MNPTIINNYDGTYTVTAVCDCGERTVAIVTGPEVFAWNQGTFVQDAFPSLSPNDREALFMSGICGGCWDAMFVLEDDYEPDEYYSGTGELVGDQSYIDYLNRD